MRNQGKNLFRINSSSMLLFYILLTEEARRLSEERLLAEQAKSEVASLRKHYSEADVNFN
jgi:hypothetical protein